MRLRISGLVPSAIAVTAISGLIVFGGGVSHASASVATSAVHAAPATTQRLDYNIIQHFTGGFVVTDTTRMVNTNGTLTGSGHDIQDNCNFTVSGTLSGSTANFTMNFNSGVCNGVVVTYTGTLHVKSGHGTFTSTNGNSGTWTAGDRKLDASSAGVGRGNRA